MRTPYQVIESTIDATFMQRGFKASTHATAVMEALTKAGYKIVPTEDDLIRIKRRLSAYYTADEIFLWLTKQHPLLNGDIPILAIHNGDVDRVDRLIDQMDTGAFV